MAIWVAGENFGGIFTGQGTDPNTGPMLVMLAIAFWPRRRVGGHHEPVPHAAARLEQRLSSPAGGVSQRRTGAGR